MRMSKFSIVIAAAMTAAGLSLVAGPAQASTSTFQITIDLGKTKVKAVYGDSIYGVDVKSATGTGDAGQALTPDTGQVDLEALYPGKDWVAIASDPDSPAYPDFGNAAEKAKGNVQYRLHYYGGTGHDADYNDFPLAGSYSNVVTVKTSRKLDTDGGLCKHHKCPLSGKVSPKYKHKKVILQTKKHSKWHKQQVIRTNKHSKFHFKIRQLINRDKKLRVIVPGNKNFKKSVSPTYHIGPF